MADSFYLKDEPNAYGVNTPLVMPASTGPCVRARRKNLLTIRQQVPFQPQKTTTWL
jgi:hypothetical protein